MLRLPMLLDRILEAKKLAVPPISNFYVGVVAVGTSGNVYYGANFEFPGEALSFTVHAEQAAVVSAMAHGETGLRMMAVSAAPCGYCRQFLNELTTASTLEILLPDGSSTSLPSLLPSAFGPTDLGIAAALMSPQSHGLTLDAPDELAAAALAAANVSYAPYTRAYAGVALRARDGAIFRGSLAENAAYNPSMSPLEAAIVNLVIDGGKSYADIAEAVLVEAAGPSSQESATRAVLAAIGSAPLRVLRTPRPA